jgi:hypothetical protein
MKYLKSQAGIALFAVIAMLLIMTTVGLGMYKLVSGTIATSAAFHKKTTTRGVAVATAGMVMDAIASSITAGTIVAPSVLNLSDPNVMLDLYGDPDSDIVTDTATSNPDFTYTVNHQYGQIVATADVDFQQSIPMAGGAIEFASAYDGVGAGQTMGSSFLISEAVKVIATDQGSGARTVINFVADN